MRHDFSEQIRERDVLKKDTCQREGIDLIIIPFWWNGSAESVAHKISVVRPDILLPTEMLTGDVILNEMPKNQSLGKLDNSFDCGSTVCTKTACGLAEHPTSYASTVSVVDFGAGMETPSCVRGIQSVNNITFSYLVHTQPKSSSTTLFLLYLIHSYLFAIY